MTSSPDLRLRWSVTDGDDRRQRTSLVWPPTLCVVTYFRFSTHAYCLTLVRPIQDRSIQQRFAVVISVSLLRDLNVGKIGKNPRFYDCGEWRL